MNLTWVSAGLFGRAVHPNCVDSPAGCTWQWDVLRRLALAGDLIRIGTHSSFRAWPKGPILRAPSRVLANTNGQTYIGGYFNIPFVRDLMLEREYTRLLASDSDLLITYNASLWSVGLGRKWRRRGGRWCLIVADADCVDDGLVGRALDAGASAWCLSSFTFQHLRRRGVQAFHCDGGIDYRAIAKPGAAQPGVFGYFGSFGKHAGLVGLIEAFRAMPERNIRLRISGFGDANLVRRLVGGDNRIEFLGCLPTEKVADAMSSVSVFVNPRPVNAIGSVHNFPSKILSYLPRLRPIISTWTPGLAPEYKKILVTTDGSVADLREKMREIALWGPLDYEVYTDQARRWIREYRDWSSQIIKLRTDLEKI